MNKPKRDIQETLLTATRNQTLNPTVGMAVQEQNVQSTTFADEKLHNHLPSVICPNVSAWNIFHGHAMTNADIAQSTATSQYARIVEESLPAGSPLKFVGPNNRYGDTPSHN